MNETGKLLEINNFFAKVAEHIDPVAHQSFIAERKYLIPSRTLQVVQKTCRAHMGRTSSLHDCSATDVDGLVLIYDNRDEVGKLTPDMASYLSKPKGTMEHVHDYITPREFEYNHTGKFVVFPHVRGKGRFDFIWLSGKFYIADDVWQEGRAMHKLDINISGTDCMVKEPSSDAVYKMGNVDWKELVTDSANGVQAVFEQVEFIRRGCTLKKVESVLANTFAAHI